MSKKSLWTLLPLIGILAPAGAAFAATELAKVNKSVITLEDFSRKYKENLRFFQFKAPTKEGILDDLVKRELGIQEAKSEGLDKDPDVVDRMNTVLYHSLVEKKLSKEFEKIHITDDEAQKYYGSNPEIRTSHIFVAIRPDASAEDVKAADKKIKEIEEKIKEGKMSFAEVAQRHSEGVAAPMGGDIDYQTKDKLDPTYYKTAIDLKSPGKVSKIVRTQFGLHIIKLTAVRSWEDADKAQVKRQLFDQRRADVFEKYMEGLKKKAQITLHKELLKD